MTIKELIEILQNFPEDKKVFVWANKGFIDYTAADCWSGPGEINAVVETKSALSKSLKGNLLLQFLTQKEINEKIHWNHRNDRVIILDEKSGTKYDSANMAK